MAKKRTPKAAAPSLPPNVIIFPASHRQRFKSHELPHVQEAHRLIQHLLVCMIKPQLDPESL